MIAKISIMTFKYVLHIILAFLFCLNALTAQIYYVSSNAMGQGGSWSDASGDLQQILVDAPAGSQIWVAAGTYYPVQCSPCTESEKNMSFEIPDSVEVYGGFTGSEASLEQRNWELNETILSADLDQDNTSSNNAKTIVRFFRVSNKTVLDGFSIVDGYAYDPNASTSSRENSGAAIFNEGGLAGGSSNPQILNCNFSNNIAFGYGGAVFNNGSFEGSANPFFENCNFSNNTSELGGGAIFNQASFSGNTLPFFTGCTFKNNEAFQGSGGGVYNQGAENGNCNPTFLDCLFEGNITSSYGGGIYSHAREGSSNPVFEDCIFLNNEARFGGGSSNNGSVNGVSNASFTNCLFENNHVSFDGAGIYNWGSDNGRSNPTIIDCILRNNTSDFAGAGLFNNGINGESIANIINCQFIDNIATTYGGAIYNQGKNGNASATITNSLFQDNYGSSAGGIYNLGSENGNASPRITNCTFYGNTANVGGAIYSNANDSTGTASPLVTNCIFWKNEASFGRVFRNVFGTPFIQYSAVDESECDALNSGTGSVVTCGTGLTFNIYPKFVDTLARDFRLKPDSPLLNIGDNTAIDTLGINIDLNHQERIYNGVVDFGAYEYYDNYVAPSITSHPIGSTLCEQGSFNLEVVATGTPPLAYQWFKNNSPINNANDTNINITGVDIADAGDYYCQVASSQGDTVISDVASVIIDSILISQINIETTDLSICDGDIINLNTSSNGGGDTPSFQWYKNGSLIQETSDSIELQDLSDNDEIVVELNSSANCVESQSVYDTVYIEVAPLLNAAIEILGPDSIICFGDEIVFESIVSNEGASPQFRWFLNNIEVSGENDNSFISDILENNDVVTCQLISSENCVINPEITSNQLLVQVEDCNTTSLYPRTEHHVVEIFPNPSRGDFLLKTINLQGSYSIGIHDIVGRTILKKQIDINAEIYNTNFTLPDTGIYFIILANEYDRHIKKIVVSKQ